MSSLLHSQLELQQRSTGVLCSAMPPKQSQHAPCFPADWMTSAIWQACSMHQGLQMSL